MIASSSTPTALANTSSGSLSQLPASSLGGVRPVKTIHIVENLDRGSAENWLVRMLGHARRRGVNLNWTFYCTLSRPGVSEASALELGAKVIHSPVPIGQKLDFIRSLRAELQRGAYEVVHCHHDLISGIYLLAAFRLKIRRRLVHVHNADEALLTPSRLKQALVREPLRFACLYMADRVIGVADHTLETFLHGRSRRNGRDLVHYSGIDPEPFERPRDGRAAFRRVLGLGEDARILLFLGRLVREKNPLFTLDVLAEMRKQDSRVVGVFAGAGVLEEVLRHRTAELRLDQAVRFLGWRTDVAEIMSACDWFILPHPEHPMEGFGLAVVEAQLAGLRLLLSRGIADDPLLPTALYRRLSLSTPPAEWATAGLQLLDRPASSFSEVREALRSSPMDMDFALNHLMELHQ
jgi:glycosyltransferase involved in cell wall biosynthesis